MNIIKRNLSWLLVSQAATWIVSVAVLLVAPRILGDEDFGQLSFVVVYVGFFDLLANFGTSGYLTKTIAREPSNVGRYVANALVMKACMTSVLIVVAVALGWILGFPSEIMPVIAVYCAGTFFSVLYTTMRGALAGLQIMVVPAIWDIVKCYAAGVGSLFVLVNHGSLFSFAVAFNLASLIPVVPFFLKLWPAIRQDHRFNADLWRQLIRGGFPFFILAALLVVYGTIDIPILQAFTGSDEVGWYTLAYRWVGVPAFFAATVAIAFFPALSAQGTEVTPAFATLANRAIRLAVFVATPAAIGIALVARPFLSLLYGAEFQQAVPLLRILALHIPIVSLDIILGSVVIAADRQRQWVMVSVVAAVFNPILNVAAIPLTQHLFGNGAIGAAIVTVLTELILMVGGLALRPKGVLDRATTSTVFRIVLASLTMVPVVVVLGSAPLVAQVLAGVVTYGLASLGLRTISLQEIRGWSGDFARRSHQPSVAP